jgi:hypothetical protein
MPLLILILANTVYSSLASDSLPTRLASESIARAGTRPENGKRKRVTRITRGAKNATHAAIHAY